MTTIYEKFKEANNDFFLKENKPIHNVYVDLEYMQDLYLGALLSTITVEEEIQYISKQLDAYNKRYDLATMKYFPVLKYKDSDLNMMLNSSKINTICRIAPFTSIYYTLIKSLILFMENNIRISDINSPVHLMINIDNFDYPEQLLQVLKSTIYRSCKNIKITINNAKRYTEPVDFYLKYDVLFLADYGAFIKEGTLLSNAFVGDGKFIDTKIVAHPYIDMSLNHKEEDYDYILASTEAGMDVFCDFCFLPSTIPYGGNING